MLTLSSRKLIIYSDVNITPYLGCVSESAMFTIQKYLMLTAQIYMEYSMLAINISLLSSWTFMATTQLQLLAKMVTDFYVIYMYWSLKIFHSISYFILPHRLWTGHKNENKIMICFCLKTQTFFVSSFSLYIEVHLSQISATHSLIISTLASSMSVLPHKPR